MTTLVLKLSLDRAKRLALAADLLGMRHEQVADEALRLFLQSVTPRSTKARATRRRAPKLIAN